jgi:hypothetical protein
MSLQLCTLDYETHWDTDYSLSRMSPLEYVMDDRFELISCAIKIGKAPTDVLFGHAEIERTFKKLDWSNKLVIAHNNSGFDCYVSAYRLKINPKMWGCTLAMARPIYGKVTGLGLGALVEYLGIGQKNNAVLMQTKGKRLADFTKDELARMEVYNREDTEQDYALFQHLRQFFTPAELWQIDALIRMRTEPAFVLDRALLQTAASVERTRKHKALLDLGSMLGIQFSEDTIEAVRQELASAPKFSSILEKLGVEVPMKRSPTKPDKLVPALAKTDEAFLALQEHDNPVVAAAALARLDVKSTLLETRIEKFLTAGRLTGGLLPIPIRYCGADTTGRDSGEEYNPQNLPRVNTKDPGRPANALRKSLRAPEGFLVAVADQSGIELRVNHFLWKVASSMELYRASPDKADLYRGFAAESLYRIAPEEVSKDQRQVGKVAQLGLGFGSGAPTFCNIARIMAGIKMPLTRDENTPKDVLTSEEVVFAWRSTYHKIVSGWKYCANALTDISRGTEANIDEWGLTHTCREGIVLPSGRLIRYPDLRMEDDGEWPDGRARRSWFYGHGRFKARITGPKACVEGDALVLTDSGWKQLSNVLPSDLLHDGVEFVRHDGLIFKGTKACVQVDGVLMTPDHEVLTDEGWVQAGASPKPYRPDIRMPDSGGVRGARRESAPRAVEVPLHMRDRSSSLSDESRQRVEAPRNPQLRVQDSRVDAQETANTWHDTAPGVRGMEVHAGALPEAQSSSVEELWGARHNRLSRVVRGLLRILGGYGRLVSAWAGPGPQGQQRGVLQGELPLDVSEKQLHEPPRQHRGGCGRSGKGHGAEPFDAVPPASSRSNRSGSGGPRRDVYDIVNCGPRKRFVVLGAGGPFIVHNCENIVQALARDSVFDCALDFYKDTGFRPKLRVHDELVYLFPDSEAEQLLAHLQGIMRTPPRWWKELVVWSEGSTAGDYGSAK